VVHGNHPCLAPTVAVPLEFLDLFDQLHLMRASSEESQAMSQVRLMEISTESGWH
jgi:hypothetical protein